MLNKYIDTIINSNCLDVLKDLPNDSIDLVLTSPPYDNLRDYDGYSFDFEKIACELFRIVKAGGVIVWVTGDATIDGSETGTSFKQALFFKEVGFNLHDTMIYKKTGISYPSTKRYHQVFEYMFVFSKDKPKTFNPLKRKNLYGGDYRKHRRERVKSGELKTKEGRKEVKDEGLDFNIWEIKNGCNKSTVDKIAFQHPAIFPEVLAEKHILSWTNENDIVLDCFNGSGTTCKMAYKHKRRYIGIDISKKYCEIASERLEDFKRQLTLF